MILDKVLITNSFEETQRAGFEFARLHLCEGAILTRIRLVALYGDLGSGKTAFAQGMAAGLGIKRRIISPTFIIVRKYELRIRNFYHIDLYRVQSERDFEALGIEEILNDEKSIVIVEWAEKLGSLLPEKRWEIGFEYLDEETRKITINKI